MVITNIAMLLTHRRHKLKSGQFLSAKLTVRFLLKLNFRALLFALPLCLATLAATAQTGQRVDNGASGDASSAGNNSSSSSNNSDYSYSKGLQLVQRVDNVLYGVDPISLAPLGNRHVSGVLVRVNVGQSLNKNTNQNAGQNTGQNTGQSATPPSLVTGYSHFVADCKKPLRMHIVATAPSPLDLTPQGSSARARYSAATTALESGVFAKAHMLDGTWAVAEFACDSTQRPARTAQIARELFEKGGPSDMRTALCDLQTDGDLQTRLDVEVRFSDAEKVVAVNKQWLSSGRVTDTEITFGSGAARWRIDRAAAEASLVHPGGKVAFVGSCIARDARP
jgi:hypothetical protein